MTKQGYRGLLRRNIEPTIGRYALAEITPSVLRDWYSTLSVNAGRDQAAKSYRLLRAILNTAVDDELVGRNPCRIRGGGTEHADERPMIDAELVFRLAEDDPELLFLDEPTIGLDVVSKAEVRDFHRPRRGSTA